MKLLHHTCREKRNAEYKRLPNGWLNYKIAQISTLRGVQTNIYISPSTIRNHKEGQMVLQGGGPESMSMKIQRCREKVTAIV